MLPQRNAHAQLDLVLTCIVWFAGPVTEIHATNLYQQSSPRPHGLFPIADYTGRLRPKKIPFQAACIRRVGSLGPDVFKREHKLPFRYLKGTFKISLTELPNNPFIYVF